MPYGNDSLGLLSRGFSNNAGRRQGGGFGGFGLSGGSGGGFGGGFNYSTGQPIQQNPFQQNFAKQTYSSAISDLINRREQNRIGQEQGQANVQQTELGNQSLADLNKFRSGLFDKIQAGSYRDTSGPIGTNASGGASFADLFARALHNRLLLGLSERG